MKRIARSLLVLVASAALLSCGSANSNDQGVAFTLFKFARGVTGSPGEVGRDVALSERGDSTASDAGYIETFYGLQNNMPNVGIQVQRAFMSYYIEGSTLQPPDSTQALGWTLAPSSTTRNGSLPPGYGSGTSNIGYVGVPIVPPDIMAWLNLHRDELPELPFQMTVRTYATGLTTAGDRLDTNSLDFRVTFVPDELIQGGDGASSSSSTADTSETETGTEDTTTEEGTN